MKIFIGIDDTDNIDSRGTGELADMLGAALEEREWGKAGAVTRHQLLVHPDIPYTSHNSSMCFTADIDPEFEEHYISFAGDFLKRECAPGSDPGLCVLVLDKLVSVQELLDFGYQAKQRVIEKSEAYEVARRNRVHLSEHGGTGQGIIGALAGAALRMGANDGRYRGKVKIPIAADIISVAEIKRQSMIEVVKTLNGHIVLNDTEKIRLGEKMKAVLLDGKCTLLVFPTEIECPEWQTCTTSQLRIY